VPPRPHPIVLIALAAACTIIALLMLPGGLAHAAHARPDVAAPRARPAPGTAHAAAHARPTSHTPPAPHTPLASHNPLAAAHARPASHTPPAPHTPLASHNPLAHRATWRWPLRGPVVGSFRLTPRSPYARGQRRGIDVAAAPGTTVRAACPGRVTFAGALPHLGLALSVRCAGFVATYLRLARLAVRRGRTVGTGEPLGTLGPAGALRLGARRAHDRRGYVDPLSLLSEATPPVLGPAPLPRRTRRARRPARPRPLRPPAPAPRRTPRPAPPQRADPARLPWPAYPAIALVATALPVGGLVRRRRRRDRPAVVPRSQASPL
jgi:hypothetical protein